MRGPGDFFQKVHLAGFGAESQGLALDLRGDAHSERREAELKASLPSPTEAPIRAAREPEQ